MLEGCGKEINVKSYLILSVKKKLILLVCKKHSVESDEWLWRSQCVGRIYFSHGTNKSCGTCIIVNNKDIEIIREKSDEEGRIILLQIKYHDKEFAIVGLYGPNEDSPRFFSKVSEWVK